jgi:hypothetical protein
VLFVSFVVKKITDKKSDFTAENAKNDGLATRSHEKSQKRGGFRVPDPFVLFVSFVVNMNYGRNCSGSLGKSAIPG